MSVPKSRRKPSHFEVFHNATELQKEVVLYVMQDFGVTQDTSLAEAHFLDLKFERIVNVCGDIIGDTNRANKGDYAFIRCTKFIQELVLQLQKINVL